MARVRSVALNILRANGVQNITQALHANAVSFDQLLALSTPEAELNGPAYWTAFVFLAILNK